jgi:hypothetical protein
MFILLHFYIFIINLCKSQPESIPKAVIMEIPEPAVLGQFTGEFDFYIKSWELEVEVDKSVPPPTNKQVSRRDRLIQ